LNIEEYISSGVLEAYAMGELSAVERAEVERNLLQHPELKGAFEQIEKTQEEFLKRTAVQPKLSVKQNLLEKIDERSSAKIIQMPVANSQITAWKYVAAASVVIAVMASYMAYNYYGRWRSSEDNLNNLIAQNQRMAQDYNSVNQRLDKIESDIKIIDNAAFSKVIMKGTAGVPEALAFVYWNRNSNEVYLSIQNMKALSQERQYQLWAMVDGKPVDAGVFDANVAGLIKMKSLSGAAAFAVTIEPRGGKPTPTLETMQVLGYVVKG
jgi:anti-sigma-K factor RskA